MKIKKIINERNLSFIFIFIIPFFITYQPVKILYQTSNQGEYYSHIMLIPFISIFLIFQKRNYIFLNTKYSFAAGLPLLLIGIIIYLTANYLNIDLNHNDYTAAVVLSAVVFINGAFLLFFGAEAYKAAIFPLLFLLLACPIPSEIMEQFIFNLQSGSTEITNLILTATGVPFLREGFVFHMSGMNIEVAKQCSGIRSAMALFITSLLAGHLFLNGWWRKIILLSFVFPIAMFKNGVRIITLTLLGTYVDPRIIQSSLHREGGIPFFILALLLMAPVLYFLRKYEIIKNNSKEVNLGLKSTSS